MEILCGKGGEILAQTLPQYFSSMPQFQEYPEKFKKFPTERPKHIWAKIEHPSRISFNSKFFTDSLSHFFPLIRVEHSSKNSAYYLFQ